VFAGLGKAVPRILRIAFVLSLPLQITAALGSAAEDSNAVGIVSRVIAAVGNASPSDHLKTARLVRNNFDLRAIAKTIAGRTWATANESQRNEFMDALLNAMLAGVFEARRLNIDIAKIRQTSNGDSLVATNATKPNGRVVRVDWRLHRCSSGLCIVDVLVSGASMALQLRDEAAAVLSAKGGGIDELSRRLRANPTHPFN
jgi:ABC-type transporter MlaC component